jgi:cell wall-associated NlpC family hydrolase
MASLPNERAGAEAPNPDVRPPPRDSGGIAAGLGAGLLGIGKEAKRANKATGLSGPKNPVAAVAKKTAKRAVQKARGTDTPNQDVRQTRGGGSGGITAGLGSGLLGIGKATGTANKAGKAGQAAKGAGATSKLGAATKGGGMKGPMPIPGAEAGQGAKSNVKGVLKGATTGAAQGAAVGAAAGGVGAAPGALIGAAKGAGAAVVRRLKPKHIALLVVLLCLPTFIEIFVIVSAVSGSGSTASLQADVGAESSMTTSGMTLADTQTVQAATAGSSTEWELLAATIYYETGGGAFVGNAPGQCTNPPPNAICPNVPSSTSTAPSATFTGESTGTGATTGLNNPVTPVTTVPAGVIPASSPDRTSVATPDWACIRQSESGDNYTDVSGAYGILISTWTQYLHQTGIPGDAPASLQDHEALALFADNGYVFVGTWNDSCTAGEVYPTAGNPGGGGGSGGGSSGGGGNTGPTPASKAGGLGPYGLVTPETLSPTDSADLSKSSVYVSGLISQSLNADQSWSANQDVENLGSGVSYQNGATPTMDPSDGTGTIETHAVMAALATLPIANNSATLDQNIYQLSQLWSIGVAPNGTGSVCNTTPVGGPAGGTTLTVTGPSGTPETLDPQQTANATEIATVGATLNIPAAGITVAIDAALASSDLYNLPNGNVAASLTDPNAQWGGYSSSSPPNNGLALGLFQFLPVWGNETQLMTPSFEISAFYGSPPGVATHPPGLIQIPNWQTMTVGQVAAAIEGAASPAPYDGWATAAAAVAATVIVSPSGCPTGVVIDGATTAQGLAAIKAAEAELGVPYVFGGGTATGPSGSAVDQPPALEGQPGFDCSGLMLYAFAKAGVTLPRTSEEQQAAVQSGGHYTTDLSKLVPGDLVFFTGSDGTPTSAGHVGLYLGGGNMIDAPSTGSVVRVESVDWFGGFLGGGPA